jgi:hypothetical protein
MEIEQWKKIKYFVNKTNTLRVQISKFSSNNLLIYIAVTTRSPRRGPYHVFLKKLPLSPFTDRQWMIYCTHI